MSKFIIKPKSFSWKKKYEIFDENGKQLYYVKYEKNLHEWKYIIFDSDIDDRVIIIKEPYLVYNRVTSIELYHRYIGGISVEKSFTSRSFVLDYKGWQVYGNPSTWNYIICNVVDDLVATIGFDPTQSAYAITVEDSENDMIALATAMALDLICQPKSKIL